MAEENQDEPQPADIDGEQNPYLDAADRLERGIDTQIDIINGIDDKAEHVTRLLGILIGLVFSVLSVVTNLDPVGFGSPTLPVEIGFTIGIFSLLLAMAAAVVTYLSSKFRIGLHQNVGYYLENPENETDFEEHIVGC